MDIGKEERTIHVQPARKTEPARPAKPQRKPVAPKQPVEDPSKAPVKVPA